MHPLTCLVCGKETEAAKANFCQAHSRASDRVRQAYSVWTTAYGSLSLSDFFKRVRKLPGTGQNAREIVEFLERNPPRWK